MVELETGSIIRRAELPGSRVDDEMVFFNPVAGNYYGTGPVGAEIWDFLETPRSLSEICDHLLAKFEVDRQTCEAQLRSFISEMLNEGIVQPAD
ncbi:MAG: PqqD family peptide modification chaperone [Henriciella sp.]|nr:PqqD family peptide modification chaperone [Henriciella sp.]